jgi:hypothetical protein
LELVLESAFALEAERKVFPCCSALRACAALNWGASGFYALLGEAECAVKVTAASEQNVK